MGGLTVFQLGPKGTGGRGVSLGCLPHRLQCFPKELRGIKGTTASGGTRERRGRPGYRAHLVCLGDRDWWAPKEKLLWGPVAIQVFRGLLVLLGMGDLALKDPKGLPDPPENPLDLAQL